MSDKDNQFVERELYGVKITTTLKLAAEWERFNKMGFFFHIDKEGIISTVLYRVFPSAGLMVDYTTIFNNVVNFILAWNNQITHQRGDNG